MGATPSLPRGAPLGVSAADDPSGALGAWRCTDPVAVAIPDGTRRLDLAGALGALSERLVGEMRVVVGLGLHRRMTSNELAPIAAFGPMQHDPDDVVPTQIVNGVPGQVSRAVADCAWSVSVGVAELHQYAGISGGHKGVSVGCGGRETIAALHHRDRISMDGVGIGRLDGNPFRATVDRLGQLASCRLALVHVPAVQQWLCGDPEAVLVEALARMNPWWKSPRPLHGAVVHVPPAKSCSFYQASRAATYLALSPRPPLSPQAEIVIHAACPEGLGHEAGFRAALAAQQPPWSALLTGSPPEGPGAQRAVVLALAARRYRIRVAGCIEPAALQAVGVEATSDAPPEGPGWLQVREPFQCLPQWA